MAGDAGQEVIAENSRKGHWEVSEFSQEVEGCPDMRQITPGKSNNHTPLFFKMA